MTTLKDAVRDYYNQELDDAALLRLVAARRQRPSRLRTLANAAVMATILALAALGVGLGGRALLGPTLDEETTAVLPRLVAVQIRADWCMRTPEVTPVFMELLASYGNEPVLFVTVDITDDILREQGRRLSANLGISQTFNEPFESGMIKLIDRKNDVLLATFIGGEQVEVFRVHIAEAIQRFDDGSDNDNGGGV